MSRIKMMPKTVFNQAVLRSSAALSGVLLVTVLALPAAVCFVGLCLPCRQSAGDGALLVRPQLAFLSRE